MRTVRDTATLAVVILLALTFRLETPDAVSIDVVTPAHAAMRQAPTPELASVWPDVDVARPAELRRVTASVPRIAAVPLPPGDEKKLVWEFDGKRVVIVVGEDEISCADPDPCNAHRARTSS